MQHLKIAIAGCGISGLAAAMLLARQGHEITLFERFETPQPVGSGLMVQPSGMAVLDAMGLASSVVAKGAPVDGLLGLNTEGEPVLEAAYADLSAPDVFGLGIHRASLFGALYESVLARGLEVRTGHEIADTKLEGKGRSIIFADGAVSQAL